MADFMDHLVQYLYEGTVGKSETNLEELTLLNVWKYFIECGMKDSRAKECVIKIQRTGNHYDVQQLVLNGRREPIYLKGDFVFGRALKAYSLDEDLLDLMDGNDKCFLQLSALKQKKQSE